MAVWLMKARNCCRSRDTRSRIEKVARCASIRNGRIFSALIQLWYALDHNINVAPRRVCDHYVVTSKVRLRSTFPEKSSLSVIQIRSQANPHQSQLPFSEASTNRVKFHQQEDGPTMSSRLRLRLPSLQIGLLLHTTQYIPGSLWPSISHFCPQPRSSIGIIRRWRGTNGWVMLGSWQD